MWYIFAIWNWLLDPVNYSQASSTAGQGLQKSKRVDELTKIGSIYQNLYKNQFYMIGFRTRLLHTKGKGKKWKRVECEINGFYLLRQQQFQLQSSSNFLRHQLPYGTGYIHLEYGIMGYQVYKKGIQNYMRFL